MKPDYGGRPPAKNRLTWIWAAVAMAIHATALTLWLLKPGANRQTLRLDAWTYDRQGSMQSFVALPFSDSLEPSGTQRLRLQLQEFFRSDLAQATSVGLRLEFQAKDTSPGELLHRAVRIDSLTLSDASGIIRFRCERRTVGEGDLVVLERTGNDTLSATGTNVWWLELAVAEPVTAALRANAGSARVVDDFRRQFPPGVLAAPLPVIAGQTPGWTNLAFAQGNFTVPIVGERMNRVTLLAKWWGFGGTTVWWVGMVVSTWVIGCAILLWLGPAPKALWTPRYAAGSGLLALGLGLDFALVAPPFQGPDEASHLVSILRWKGDSEQVAAYKEAGLGSHFSRFWSRPDQKFTSADVGTKLDWFVFSVENMDTRIPERSAVAARIWAAAWPFFQRSNTMQIMLGIRLVDLVVACLGIALGAAMATTPGHRPAAVALLLVAPSVAWFAMNLSNYAFSIGLMALAIGALTRIATGYPDFWSGIGLGAAAGLALQNSATMTPWFIGVTPPLIALALTPRNLAVERRSWFWLALWIGLVGSGLVATAEHNRLLASWANKIAGGRLAAIPWFALWWLGVTVGVAVLAVGQQAMRQLRDRFQGERTVSGRSQWRWVRWLPVIALLTWQVWNWATPTPRLPPLKEPLPGWEFLARLGLPSARPEAWNDPGWYLAGSAYVQRAVAATLGSFGLGDHDFLTSVLFWSYIGFYDVWMPDLIVSVLILFYVVGLGLLAWPRNTTEIRASPWIALAWGLGTVLCLALTAAASTFSGGSPSTHGRYLIPFYLTTMGLCGVGWQVALGRHEQGYRKWILTGFAAVLAFHHVALSFIGNRYF